MKASLLAELKWKIKINRGFCDECVFLVAAVRREDARVDGDRIGAPGAMIVPSLGAGREILRLNSFSIAPRTNFCQYEEASACARKKQTLRLVEFRNPHRSNRETKKRENLGTTAEGNCLSVPRRTFQRTETTNSYSHPALFTHIRYYLQPTKSASSAPVVCSSLPFVPHRAPTVEGARRGRCSKRNYV